MQHLIVEIIDGHNQPTSRNVTSRDGQPKTIWEQKMYVHNGGAFPVESRLSLESPAQQYPVGKYHLAPTSYQVGRYGDLEINRFEMKLVPVTQEVKKAG